MSLHKFCNTVFDNHKVEIVKALQDMINAERNGEAGVDRSLLKSVIDCFITMGCIKHLNDVRRALCPRFVAVDLTPHARRTTCCRPSALTKIKTTTHTAAAKRSWCLTCPALPRWSSASSDALA